MATNPITEAQTTTTAADTGTTTTQASQTSGPTQSSPMTTISSPVTTPASVTEGIILKFMAVRLSYCIVIYLSEIIKIITDSYNYS